MRPSKLIWLAALTMMVMGPMGVGLAMIPSPNENPDPHHPMDISSMEMPITTILIIMAQE